MGYRRGRPKIIYSYPVKRRARIPVLLAVLMVAALALPPHAGAWHEGPPEFTDEAAGIATGAGWSSLALVLPGNAHVEVGHRTGDPDWRNDSFQGGAYAYDTSEAFHVGFTVTTTENVGTLSLSSGRGGPSSMYGYGMTTEDGGLETGLGFRTRDGGDQLLHVVLWWTSDLAEREWFVRATGPVDVVNVTHGERAFLHLKEDFEAHAQPDVPLLNEATGVNMLQRVDRSLTLDVRDRLHAEFSAWAGRVVCVDRGDVGELTCAPSALTTLPWGNSRASMSGPDGATTYGGPPGEYTFRLRSYERFPYVCVDAVEVCAGERDAWWSSLYVGGADAPLAAFD